MILAWLAGCGAPEGLTAVPEGSAGTGSVRWVTGGREQTLERFSPPVDLLELERSADRRWAFARFKPEGQPLQVSVYDLQLGSRVHAFAPGFGGDFDFTRSGEGFVHVWGCGSGCVTLRVLDRDGAVRFEGSGSRVSMAPDGAALLLAPTVLGPDHPIAWVDLDARRLVARFAPWEGWEQPVGAPIWGDPVEIPVGTGRLAVDGRGSPSWTVPIPPPPPQAVVAGRAAAVRAVASAGSRDLALDRVGLDAGDEGLLVQTVGAGAGRFERVVVEQEVDGGVRLAAPLSADFGPGAQLVQIVRGPHLTVDGTLRVPPWDGQVGGVLALRAGRLTLNGRIDADGAGLRGGRAPGARHAQSCLTSDDPRNAERGEGADGRMGPGFLAPSTGGGGGGCHNAGGGGGAGGGAGGRGGFSWINEANARGDVGGRGGQPGAGLLPGGGGGAGQTDRPEAPGGRGGGVIWVEASEIVGGGGLSARGLPGVGPEREGAGGGGGGGTIWLAADRVEVHADVSGGAGANALEAALGPGGGGGGGRIVGPPGMDAVLTGGPGGLDPRGDPYGATAGQPGVLLPSPE